jgi:hypothetical protein
LNFDVRKQWALARSTAHHFRVRLIQFNADAVTLQTFGNKPCCTTGAEERSEHHAADRASGFL